MAKLKISIAAENIGPHSRFGSKIETTSAKIGIYANNGSGKTFLSKAFSIYERAKSEKLSSLDIDRLLSFGKDTGSFSFEVEGTDPPEPAQKLEISLSRNTGVSVVSQSKYRFNVFNSDYVKKNLESKRYSPTGEIPGVILGSENIDVANEAERLKSLEVERVGIDAKINDLVERARTNLGDLGVRRNLTEMTVLATGNILNPEFKVPDVNDFEVLKERLKKLESMPEDLEDLVNLSPTIQLEAREKLDLILETSHSRADFSEDFKERLKADTDFYRRGIRQVKNETCPFCLKPLQEKGLQLIEEYEAFLNDQESRVVNEISDWRSRLLQYQASIGDKFSDLDNLSLRFEHMKSFLPAALNLGFETLSEAPETAVAFQQLDAVLLKKQQDVSFSVERSELDQIFSNIESTRASIDGTIARNASPLAQINRLKNDLTGQKRDLKKELCYAKFADLRSLLEPDLLRRREIVTEVASLTADIREKQAQNKRAKKDEVARTFEGLLRTFFGDKYSFDPDKFCLTFTDSRLASNADDVLSDGEKGIVAFCHYIAMTHTVVDSDDDYQNLFFVIDDPISSMDFHYVYKVAEIIRNLNGIFPHIKGRIRFLVLTHNLEFISILGRNGICAHTYGMRNGKLSSADLNSALPYDLHLEDIIKIANGKAEPNHTTGNSIRHILETVGKFVQPGIAFEKFFVSQEALNKEAFLWTLINDQSHGAVRVQPEVLPDEIVNCCAVVADYLLSIFPHQISAAKKRVGI